MYTIYFYFRLVYKKGMKDRILHRIRKIFQDTFWKNVFTLFSGSAIAQAVPIIIFPFLTRIYPKDIVGVYFLYSSVIIVTQIIATFQFQLAIVLPKDEKEAKGLLVLNLFSSFVMSGIMFVFIFIFKDFLVGLTKEESFIKWFYAIPISTFLLGIFNASSYYLNRIQDYKNISIGKILKSLTLSLAQLILGFIGYLKTGLIYSLILGQLLSALYMLFVLFKSDKYIFKVEFEIIKQAARKYKDIPLFNSIISLLNNLSNQMPMFLITRYFGASAASDYGLANKVISTPTGLVAHSVGQVFYQESSEIVNNKKDLRAFVKNTYKQLFRLAIVPFSALLLIAPWLFKILFSESYFIAGQYTQILIPWFFLNFLNMPVSFLFTTLNKQKQLLSLNTILIVARFAALFVGFYFYEDIYISLVLFTGVSVIYYLYMYWYLLRISNIAKVYGYGSE